MKAKNMNDVMVKTILRWFLFLPTAIIIALAANVISVLLIKILLLTNISSDSFYFNLINYSLSGFATGFVFNYIGVHIAPTMRSGVSIFLVILTIFGSSLNIAGMLFTNYIEKDYWLILFLISASIGSLYSYQYLKNEEYE